MKKVLCIVMLIFISVSIIACEKEKNIKDRDTKVVKTKDDDKLNNDETNKVETNNDEIVIKPIEAIDLVDKTYENSIYKVKQEKFEYSDEAKNIKVNIEYPSIEVKGNSEVTERINNKIKQYALKNEQDEQYKNRYHFIDNCSYYITYNSDSIISFYISRCTSAGRSSTSDYGLNFDINTGELFSLDKIDIDNDIIKKIIEESSVRRSNKYASVTLSKDNYEKMSDEYLLSKVHNDDYYIRDGKIAFMLMYCSNKAVFEFEYNWKFK